MTELIFNALMILIKEVPAWIDELERRGELTAEQAAARRAEMQTAFASSAWQPETASPPPPVEPPPAA